MAASNTKKIILTEVGPRDGLQNEKEVLSTASKLELIHRLADAGFKQIEVGSFVSPKWVPQMGDTAELFAKLQIKKGVRYIALVPNLKGLEGAIGAGVKEIAVFTAASETFNKKNINRTIEESLQDIQKIVELAKSCSMWVRGYVSTCFGCPYEGKMNPQKVAEISQKLFELGMDEISLGDTIGVATPNQVEELLALLNSKIPLEKIALHFHDTRGTALANILRSIQLGVSNFDSSAGGLGGCPYAPGASGNVATEDLLYLLQGMQIETGIDLEKVVEASQQMSHALRRKLPSRYLNAVLASKEKGLDCTL